MTPKKYLKINIGLILILLLNGLNHATAGKLKQSLKEGSEIGINIGVLQPFTDVSQYKIYKVLKVKNENQPGLGLHYTWHPQPYVGLQAQFIYGKLQGVKRVTADVYMEDLLDMGFSRNICFNSNVMEVSLRTHIIFSNLKTHPFSEFHQKGINFYLLGGIGMVSYDAKIYNLRDKLVESEVYNTLDKGISGAQSEIVVPVGLGCKIRLNDALDFGIEASMQLLNTDNLDALVYTGGFGGYNDKYGYINVNLSYKLFKEKSARSKQWELWSEQPVEPPTE